MRSITLRKSTLAVALGALMAASVLTAAPVRAEGEGGDPMVNTLDSRLMNNRQSYTTTTTYYSAPAYVAPAYVAPTYVPAPAPAMSYTTVSPSGTTTTTTYGNPSVAYVPAPAYVAPVPAYSSTTVIETKPCNSFDVPRPGVTTACPY